jgi:hypothetical protein
LRCRACGAKLDPRDYYDALSATSEDELERHLANIPVNRL